MRHDVVYILRNDIDSTEVKYSIRSVVRNFPFNSLWIYGGKPNDIRPDHYVNIKQQGENKWKRVTNTIRTICLNDDITENFWLFNDDFFIMQKIETFPTLHQGTLQERVDKIRKRHGCDSQYSKQLNKTIKVLQAAGLEQIDYALHCPILINRGQAIQTIDRFRNCPMFRSLYGNHHKIGGQYSKDYKIQSKTDLPSDNSLFVSTSDRAYYYGAVGKYIRETFNEPSRYELY